MPQLGASKIDELPANGPDQQHSMQAHINDENTQIPAHYLLSSLFTHTGEHFDAVGDELASAIKDNLVTAVQQLGEEIVEHLPM